MRDTHVEEVVLLWSCVYSREMLKSAGKKVALTWTIDNEASPMRRKAVMGCRSRLGQVPCLVSMMLLLLGAAT